jgi:hypothetical protein
MNPLVPLTLDVTPWIRHRYYMNLHLCLTPTSGLSLFPFVREAPVLIRSWTAGHWCDSFLTPHHCYVMSPSAGFPPAISPFSAPADTIVLCMACMILLLNLSVTFGRAISQLHESHDDQPANQSVQSSAAVIQPATEIELVQAPSRSNVTYA